MGPLVRRYSCYGVTHSPEEIVSVCLGRSELIVCFQNGLLFTVSPPVLEALLFSRFDVKCTKAIIIHELGNTRFLFPFFEYVGGRTTTPIFQQSGRARFFFGAWASHGSGLKEVQFRPFSTFETSKTAQFSSLAPSAIIV